MKEAGFEFRVEVRSTEEDFPLDMPPAEVAEYLARHKAEQFSRDLGEELVLCADTIVVVDSTILNKPADAAEAGTMLRMLSGRTHQVITGLCLLSGEGSQVVSDVAHVTFRELVQMEIDYYIQQYRPFDKAGAYGIQEWIGMVGIERIEGSYYTIMGLPVHKVYQLLKSYVR
jgi:septum formation protein